jgi:hypothetical protein
VFEGVEEISAQLQVTRLAQLEPLNLGFRWDHFAPYTQDDNKYADIRHHVSGDPGAQCTKCEFGDQLQHHTGEYLFLATVGILPAVTYRCQGHSEPVVPPSGTLVQGLTQPRDESTGAHIHDFLCSMVDSAEFMRLFLSKAQALHCRAPRSGNSRHLAHFSRDVGYHCPQPAILGFSNESS